MGFAVLTIFAHFFCVCGNEQFQACACEMDLRYRPFNFPS